MEHCPCGSESAYESCCGKYIESGELPSTAEECMRSRYSAYVKGNIDYIEGTHHPSSRDEFDKEETKKWASESEWNGLEIVQTHRGGVDDSDGVVEFIAKYAINDEEYAHHEVSEFEKRDGQWFFKDGKIVGSTLRRTAPKVGRNDPCPCGSGKKYKKCCL